MKTETTLAALFLIAAFSAGVEAENKFEGKLESFTGKPLLEIKQIFKGGRFPNIVAATDGTVLAFWNGIKVRRSEDGGITWGQEILIGKGHMGGGVTVNEGNGDIFVFIGRHHPPTRETIYRSCDHGKSWSVEKATIKPDCKGHKLEMHMNEHGITLRHSAHKGRLIRPARYYGKNNAHDEWPTHYTSAIYSDDNGKTWHSSDPFPAFGTGEAAVAELSDGRIYYNSRRHWAPKDVNNLRRWTAWSCDGGETWKKLSICEVLPDGPQNTGYGCMGGLVRLPVKDRNILLYSNCDSNSGRNRGTVWASFDGGGTWPIKRMVTRGGFAYSSINAGRPGTASKGWIYLMFESGGARIARFNLSWLLQGKKTGNGNVPNWIIGKDKK